jgi:hypothetical protein
MYCCNIAIGQFLGSKVVDRGTSDIELGCLLHSIGTKKWPKWRKRTPVTLGFVQKSFVITFNHHGEVNLLMGFTALNVAIGEL